MKLELSRQIFVKSSNIKFLKNSFSGGRDVPCGGTDRRNEAKRTDGGMRGELFRVWDI